MELTTECYLGSVTPGKFAEIVDWCVDYLGDYGVQWKLDWNKHTIYLTEKNAILFVLKWSN